MSGAAEERVVVQAPVRIGRRTKDLVKQLLPGEIAVIDHADLDRVAAEGLSRPTRPRCSTSPRR